MELSSNGGTSAEPWPCSQLVRNQTISVQCWGHQTSPCLTAGNMRSILKCNRKKETFCSANTRRPRAEQTFAAHQLIKGHLWTIFIKQVPPCGSTNCSKTHISCRKNRNTHVNPRCCSMPFLLTEVGNKRKKSDYYC